MSKQRHHDPDWDFKPTDAQLRNVRPIQETDPAVVAAMVSARETGVSYRARGRPKTAEPKVRTSILPVAIGAAQIQGDGGGLANPHKRRARTGESLTDLPLPCWSSRPSRQFTTR
jgi:hypothetical protein